MNPYDYIDDLPASQFNAYRGQQQNDWNSNAAAQWQAHQQAAQQPQFDQSDVIGMRDWTNRQMQGGNPNVGWSRMGDELYIGGKPQSLPDFQRLAQSTGFPIEDLFEERAAEERTRRAAAMHPIAPENRYQTFASNPQLRNILEPQRQAMYGQAFGMDPQKETAAQYAAAAQERAMAAQERLAGNDVARQDLNERKFALTEKTQAAQDAYRQQMLGSKQEQQKQSNLMKFNQAYGFHPSQIVQYDQATQTATVEDNEGNQFKRVVPISDFQVARQAVYDPQAYGQPAAAAAAPSTSKPKTVRQGGVLYRLQPDGGYLPDA